MRIAIVAVHFAEYSLCLARALAERHSVLLILNEVNFKNEVGLNELLTDLDRLRVVLLPHKRSARVLFGNAYKIVRSIKEFKPDIVHVQEEPKDYLLLATFFLRNMPFVLTVHDPSPHAGEDAKKVKGTRRGRYIQYLRERSTAIIVHGEHLRKVAKNVPVHPKGRVFSVHHGPLGELFNSGFSTKWIDGNCLFFGRIEAYKGLGVFIRAINSLNDAGYAVRGVVAGRGSELDLYRESLSDVNRFEVLEKYLSVDEVLSVFKDANVVVLPYLEATQSGVSAYAVGLGRPVVASNVGGLPESVIDGVTGLLVPPGDPDMLAQSILQLVSDRSRAQSMAQNAYDWGREALSWRSLSVDTENVYLKAIESLGK